ncbi:helix-turn-helix domain-containing protein [Aliihoeflea sp. PC F10.4]
MDKRDLSAVFRERLKLLLTRHGRNQSTFAASVGIDRSALSQLLAGQSTRLPRAETLLNIAETYGVSLDWLMGLSQDEGLASEIRESLEIEEGTGGFDHTLLAAWHAEAAGAKVRYVPAGIPDLLRSDAVIAYEAGITRRNRENQIDEKDYRIGYNRRPETDMEVCMPRHMLEIFAKGNGVWSGLSDIDRRAQLDHMAQLIDDLYPSFRLYLYDGRQRYSIPYTIFGQIRAAIFVGDMYLVLNAVTPIQKLTRHFDNLIRAAEINAHETAAYCRELSRSLAD